VGAGDIAACNSGPVGGTAAAATAALVEAIPGTVFTAGDDAYEDGTPVEFQTCYDPTWGAFKDRTLLPAAGNHDFNTPGGAGYFGYFGARAGTPGEGWYSTDIGGWHIVVLNSNCTIVGCGPGSPQYTWLQEDLADHPTVCTLAIWHHPRFSSGFHQNALAVAPFWALLSAAHADLIINGHDHDYERFAPQSPAGALDTVDGIREIVVGTGGAPLRRFGRLAANSEVENDSTHGVIVLTLHAASYDWRFVPVAGETFTDSGSSSCH
jgi:acid phosphatase type 7